jgi:hypothetical protein
MARNPVLQARTKHIKMNCHLIKDYVKNKRMQLQLVKSRKQIADVLKKFMNTVHFHDIDIVCR